MGKKNNESKVYKREERKYIPSFWDVRGPNWLAVCLWNVS